MSETPTNRTPEVVSLPNGTCSVDTCVGRTVFASPAPAPELLSAERLAEIAAQLALPRARNAYVTEYGVAADVVDELLAHAAAQAEQIRLLTMWADSAEWAVAEMRAQWAAAEARATEAEAQVAMLKTELAEQERELSYERQMRRLTLEAMGKLAGRVKEQTAELAEQEVEKLDLVKELGKAKQDLGYAAVKVGLLLGDLPIAKRNGPL